MKTVQILALLIIFSLQSLAQTVDSILHDYYQLSGINIESIQSAYVEVGAFYNDPSTGTKEFKNDIQKIYRIWPDKQKTVFVPAGATFYVSSNASYYKYNGIIHDLTSPENVLFEFYPTIIKNFVERSYTQSYDGIKKIDSKEMYEVKLVGKSTINLYFDVVTGLLHSFVFDHGIETYLDDYRQVNQMKLPFHVSKWKDDQIFFESKYLQFKINPPLDSIDFNPHGINR